MAKMYPAAHHAFLSIVWNRAVTWVVSSVREDPRSADIAASGRLIASMARPAPSDQTIVTGGAGSPAGA